MIDKLLDLLGIEHIEIRKEFILDFWQRLSSQDKAQLKRDIQKLSIFLDQPEIQLFTGNIKPIIATANPENNIELFLAYEGQTVTIQHNDRIETGKLWYDTKTNTAILTPLRPDTRPMFLQESDEIKLTYLSLM